MEALRRVMRYPLRTQDAYIKLGVQSGNLVLVELVGYSDSDGVGDLSSRQSQSAGHVDSDGCSLSSFSRTRSGMAECCATSSTAEKLLHLRAVLEHFESRVSTTLFCDSAEGRGIGQRAGL